MCFPVTITVECDDPDYANDLFDWLSELPTDATAALASLQKDAPEAQAEGLVGELRNVLAEQTSHCDWMHDKAVASFMEAHGQAILTALSRNHDEALQAENKRLREGIARLHNTINVVGSPFHRAQQALDDLVVEVKAHAKAALKEPKP